MPIRAIQSLQLAVVLFAFASWGNLNPSSGRSSFPLAVAAVAVAAVADDPETTASSAAKEEGILTATKKSESCRPCRYDASMLQDPCQLDASLPRAPDDFSLVFPTSRGTFTAKCLRARAPVWADRVYKLARYGYYNENYFFRVIPGRYTQFGTNGHPPTSNMYNYTSTSRPECSILNPQPPFMPYCMASHHHPTEGKGSNHHHDCEGVHGLSNDFGTLAMSTSYKTGLEGYPNGVTWNATAELFINTGTESQRLDSNLFVPICTISKDDMDAVVLKFPSFGEVSELGGDGPSLGRLYEEGNAYIESHSEWKDSMAITGTVQVCP